MLNIIIFTTLVWFSVSSFAPFETEYFEQIMEELSEQPEDSILLDEIKKMNSGLASNKEQPEITEEDLEANPQAYSSEQIEGVLRNKRSIRTKLDDYLRMSSSLLPTTPREALDTVGTLREELQANGIDPEYERYREKIKRNEDIVYSVTRYINPTTGLFGDVPAQDVTNNKLEKILSAEQIRDFNNAPQFMRDKYVFNRIVENFFPEGEMDKGYALELLKKHYQTDSMHGVISKYAQELQRNKEEETAYNEASTRFFDSFIETGGDYQKAIDSLEGNLNLYAENIFNQEPALKYIYQRAYNSVSWIKDEYIESGELDWDKMADRLLKLGEGETFSLAIQMLPYMLPKDNRTWLMQVIDDTVEDVPRFLRLSFSNVGDKEIERLALNIQKSYRDRRDIPRSWLGKFGRTVMEQVSKITAVTVSALGSAAAFSGTGPGALIAGGVAATTVGSMVYGAPKGLEAYRANLSGVGAVSYGITVFIGFGVAVVVGLIAIITLFLVVRLIRSIRRGWSFTRWACFLTVFLLGVAVVGGGYSFLWKNYLLPYGYYTLLRLSVAGLSVWLAYSAVVRKFHPLLILLPCLLSILYQPLVKVTFEQETWLWINLATMPILVLLTVVADSPERKESLSEQTNVKKEISTDAPLSVEEKALLQFPESTLKRKSFLWSWLFGFTLALINILLASFFNVWLEPTWGIYLLNPGSALFFFITGCLLKEYLEKDYIYWKYGVLFLGIFWGGIGSLVLLGGIISFF